MPYVSIKDTEMTTEIMKQENNSTEAIQTPKKIWITAFIFAFFALLCDGADLGFLALSLTSLKAEFHLTGLQAGMLGSLTLFGSAIGGLFGGWACDRFGRVRVIVFFVAYSSVLTCALGFTHSYEQFAVIRVFGSMGLGALYIACNVLISEMIPTKHRSTALATLMTGYTLGSLLATLLAGHIIPIHGWRFLYWIAITPIVLSILMHFMVPESESWKRSRQLRAAKIESNTQSAKPQSTYREIFKDKKHGTMFILWFCQNHCRYCCRQARTTCSIRIRYDRYSIIYSSYCLLKYPNEHFMVNAFLWFPLWNSICHQCGLYD